MGILLEKLGGEKNSKGWALEALEKFRKLGDINSLPALDLVKQDPSKSLNKEFNVYLIAPTDNELQKLVKEKNKGLTQGWLGNWKKKTIAGTEEVEKNVKASKKWFNKNKKTSRDKSVYNLSSIVFKIPGTEGGILLTGDSTGPILDDYYDQKSKSFRVMKVSVR